MAGMSDVSESNLLKLLFNNTTWAGVGDATGIVGSTGAGSLYVSLHSAALTDTADQTTSEVAYTNYARVAVARSTGGWTVSGTTQVANTAAVTFPQCGATGATVVAFGIGKALTGVGELIAYGAASLAVSTNITPSFAIGALVVTLD